MAKNLTKSTSAAPGSAGDEKAAKTKKVPAKRIAFLAEGADKLLHNDARLKDHNLRTHFKLKPSDFTSKSEAMRYRATVLEAAAGRYRVEADRLESLGAIADNKKAKRLLALTAQMDALKASLAGEGVDVAALLQQMGLVAAPAAADAPAQS